jgi:hypothetical protein
MYVIDFLSMHLQAEIIKAQPKKEKADPNAVKVACLEAAVAILIVCPLILCVSYLWHLSIVAWS